MWDIFTTDRKIHSYEGLLRSDIDPHLRKTIEKLLELERANLSRRDVGAEDPARLFFGAKQEPRP